MDQKILFVDDERSILNGIERRFGFEYELETALSGIEALRVLSESGPFTVIFTDMRMPKMNGLEFIEKARKISPDSVYVMLTGNNDKETANNAIQQGGVYRFLNKPCDAEELKKTIEDCQQQYEAMQQETVS